LVAATNKLVDLLPLVPEAIFALNSITPGEVIEIGQKKKWTELP
jgi:hypothetical protein